LFVPAEAALAPERVKGFSDEGIDLSERQACAQEGDEGLVGADDALGRALGEVDVGRDDGGQ
jgi:hypothetical protein